MTLHVSHIEKHQMLIYQLPESYSYTHLNPDGIVWMINTSVYMALMTDILALGDH